MPNLSSISFKTILLMCSFITKIVRRNNEIDSRNVVDGMKNKAYNQCLFLSAFRETIIGNGRHHCEPVKKKKTKTTALVYE